MQKRRLPIKREYISLFILIVTVLKQLFVFARPKGDICDAPMFIEDIDEELLSCASDGAKMIEKDKEWMKQLNRLTTTNDRRKYLERVLGPLGIELANNLNEDLIFLAVIFDEALIDAMPLIKAWENTLVVLTENQRIELSNDIPIPISMLGPLISLENEFGNKVLTALPCDMIKTATSSPNISDLDKIIPTIDGVCEYLRHDAENRIKLIDEKLVKKLRGAIDALDYSEDGISQASNSLVELIDRMLRNFANDEYVIDWLNTNGFKGVKYTQEPDTNGIVRPTKFAQCLCFLYGGGHPPQGNIENIEGQKQILRVYYYLAQSLVNARNELQAIKHSDEGTEIEKDRILVIKDAILGFIEIAHKLCWIYKGYLPSAYAPFSVG